MAYKKSEMVYHDYVWTAKEDEDNPFIRGGKEHRELNRKEGWEMLYFINHMNWIGQPSVQDFHKAEKLIRNYVPTSLHDRMDINKWLMDNWKKYIV